MKLVVVILIVGFACVLEAGKHDPLLEALVSAAIEEDAIRDTDLGKQLKIVIIVKISNLHVQYVSASNFIKYSSYILTHIQ